MKTVPWWHRIVSHRDSLVLLTFLILSLVLNVPAYQYNSTSLAKLSVLSIDEWSYFTTLERYIYGPLFLEHDIKAVLSFNSIYGSLFWYVYSLVTASFHAPEQFTQHLIALRTVSAIWLGLAIFFVYKLINLIHRHWLNAGIAALGLFTMPALYFYVKPFSPEFMASALGLMALYAIVRTSPNLGRWWLLGTFLLGLAAGTKLSVGLFAIAALVSAIMAFRRNAWRRWLVHCCLGVVLLSSAFLISNPYIMVDRTSGWSNFISNVQAVLQDNASGHGTGQDITWAQWWPFIQEHFWPASLLLIGSFAYIYACLQGIRRKQYTIFILAITYLAFTLYILMRTNVLWTWYLFPAMFLSVIGLGAICWEQVLVLRPWVRYESIALVCVIGLGLVWSTPRIVDAYQEAASREYTPHFQNQVASDYAFRAWLNNYRFSYLTILKSPYIYLTMPEDKAPNHTINIVNILGTFSTNHIRTNEPSLLLIQKNYEFLDPMTAGRDMDIARSFYQALVSTGVEIEGQWYYYRLVLETKDFYVYERYFK